jgi:hypothetical protein
VLSVVSLLLVGSARPTVSLFFFEVEITRIYFVFINVTERLSTEFNTFIPTHAILQILSQNKLKCTGYHANNGSRNEEGR